MLKKLKDLSFIILIGFSSFSDDAFAETIRWVKVIDSNSNLAIQISVTSLDNIIYSCGDHCQLIKLMTTYKSDRGNVIINLHHTKCGSNGTISLPFITDDEELTTPTKIYTVSMNGGYCKPQQLQANVTGNPDSVFGYKVEILP